MDDVTGAPTADRVLTIPEFCQRNLLSRARYFTLKRDGKAPREMRPGLRVGITLEAERDWRRAMEAEAAADRTT